jgi:hypothetical protein
MFRKQKNTDIIINNTAVSHMGDESDNLPVWNESGLFFFFLLSLVLTVVVYFVEKPFSLFGTIFIITGLFYALLRWDHVLKTINKVISAELSIKNIWQWSVQQTQFVFQNMMHFLQRRKKPPDKKIYSRYQLPSGAWRKKKNNRSSVKVTNLALAESDTAFHERGRNFLDLTKLNKNVTKNIKANFYVFMNVEKDFTVTGEVDTDSQITIISEQYFRKLIIQKVKIEMLSHEPPPVFNGFGGGGIVSPFPPVILEFMIGGAKFKQRFVVSEFLNNVPILLGSDFLFNYHAGLVPEGNGEQKSWRFIFGEGGKLGSVPVMVKYILTDNQSTNVHKLEIITDPRSICDNEFEEIMSTGYTEEMQKGGKIIDKESELNFLKNDKHVPDSEKQELIKFLDKYPDLYSGAEFNPVSFPTSVFEHDIEMIDDAPHFISSDAYKTAGIRLEQLRETIDDMVTNGILIKGDSAFVSPVFYVSKKVAEGKTAKKGRLCFDYRKLNSIIKPLHFPILNQKNFFEQASNYTYFSSIDISNAFLSISLTERAQKMAAIITPFGTYLPTRSPFGLKTSPSAFCCALSHVLGDLPWVSSYMDDILIGSSTHEEMTFRLKIVFKRLHDFNLKIQISKTKLYRTELKMLGIIFSRNGKKIDPEKVSLIKNFPPIRTLKNLQSFLGMVAYLSPFIPHYSTSLYPIFERLRNQSTTKFSMTKEAEDAVERIKEFLCQETMLYNPRFDEPFYIITDASNVAIGSLLYQLRAYPKTEEGKELMLKELGFLPEDNNLSKHLIPGVSPGRQTPIVCEFLKDKSMVQKN